MIFKNKNLTRNDNCDDYDINCSIDRLDESIKKINSDISVLEDILATHISNYKDNYDIYCKESNEIVENYNKIKDYINVLNKSLSTFIEEQIYNNRIIELSIELSHLRNDFNISMITSEFIALNDLPWYKKIFKSIRMNAISKSASRVIESKKLQLDKKREELEKVIAEMKQWEEEHKNDC